MRALPLASFSVAVSLILFGVSCQPRPKTPLRVFSDTVEPAKANVDRIKRDIATLASKEFEGRGPGSKGLSLAAELIASEFTKAKLVPAGDDGYWANFEVPSMEQELGVIGQTRDGFQMKKPGYLVSFGGVSPAGVEGELVYDLFEEDPAQPLTGKIALMPEWLREDFTTKDLRERILRAHRAGAVAVLTIPHELYPPPLDPPSVGVLPIPAARVHPILGARWLSAAPSTQAFSLRFLGRGLTAARNVVGVIPGRASGGAIVVSAHYDHVGLGRPTWDRQLNTLYPGADDNASGTAALMEIARILSALPSCERPVVFAAYAYEEEGLLGSEALLAAMKPQIAMVINLDMVGRKNALPVEVNGEPSKAMRVALNEVFQGGWFYGKLPSAEEGPQSDHSTFVLRGIPAVTLTTGLHDDHHRPTDMLERVDLDGVAEIVDRTVALVRELNCSR